MNAEQKIGKVPADDGRDAVHVAIANVVVGRDLAPGEHVGLADGVAIPTALRKIGVVDPFRTKMIPAGTRFWLFLYPNQVRSLRHEWTHPAFDKDCPEEPYQFVPTGLIQEGGSDE
jgi:hypothetical protein